METMLSEEMTRDDLIKTFQCLFDLNVLESTVIRRGWLNLKWKVTTDSGHFHKNTIQQNRVYQKQNKI